MNIQEFLNQGGYAFYVWGAYGMAIIVLSLEIIFLKQQHTKVIIRIQRLLRRQQQENSNESTT